MVINKKWKLLFSIMLFFSTQEIFAAEEIIVERYENWHHPVLAVFKKYRLLLNKIDYSMDKKCPTFNMEKMYDPFIGSRDSKLHDIYYETLKANSYFPYAIDDKINRINVGWKDKEKIFLAVDVKKSGSKSLCRYGGENLISKPFIVSPEMKKRIMKTTLKVSLRRGDGKKIIAYLYAEDEEIKPWGQQSDKSGITTKHELLTGHYYIYLYDVDSDLFFPNRTTASEDYSYFAMYKNGFNFFVLPASNKNQSDVILLRSSSSCQGSYYTAYGFDENQLSLKSYVFTGKDKFDGFSGIIKQGKNQNKLVAYGLYDWEETQIQKIYLRVSNIPGEIKLNLPKTPKLIRSNNKNC